MRRLAFIIIALVLAGGAIYIYSNLPKTASVVAGDLAPDFTLEDTNGQQVSLAELRGKVVMLNFWATWCPPCKAEMPSMERLNKIMADDDFVMLAVNIEQNGRSVVPGFLKTMPHSYRVLYDDQGVVQKQYGVFKFPESFVIRKDGTIDQKVIGQIDWASPATVAYFKGLTQG